MLMEKDTLELFSSQLFLEKSCVTIIVYLDLDGEYIGPLIKVLCSDESKPITKVRYQHFLNSFLIQSEQ